MKSCLLNLRLLALLTLGLGGCLEEGSSKAARNTSSTESKSDLDDKSLNSVLDDGETSPSPPSTPKIIQVFTVGPQQINVVWASETADVEGFIIERQRAPDTDWQEMGTTTGTEYTFEDAFEIWPSTRYSYRVAAFDSGGRSSPSEPVAVETAGLPLICPTNFVKIPANPAVGVSAAFCVMKFEAKIANQVDGNQPFDPNYAPIAASASTPWVRITRDQAESRCKLLGSGFDLISNAQWQAIARDIETVRLNWSSGVVGFGSLNRGHSDLAPGVNLAAGDDADPCVGTENLACANPSTTDFAQNRVHTLSTGEKIWDIAGNVWEWVKDNNTSPQGEFSYVAQYKAPAYDLVKWGTAKLYQALNPTDGGGLGYGYLNYAGGAIVRGGSRINQTFSGVYASHLKLNANEATTDGIGFRCVLNGGAR